MTDILITSSVLISVVFAARLAFRRTLSCRIRYALWGLVALRLLLPVQLPAADFSVLNGARTVQTQIVRFTDAPIFPAAPEIPPTPSDAEPVPTKAPVRTLTASEWLNVIWITGMAVTGGAFLLSNLRFRRFLYGKRKLYDNVSASRAVYLVENGLPSPCLFGLLRPSIYVTPAAVADPERLRHVIAHEETHARHCDTLWSLLRCVCLTVYWFDPLVWAAAFACACTFTGKSSDSVSPDSAAPDDGANVIAISTDSESVATEIVIDRLKAYPDSYSEIIQRDDLVIQNQDGSLLNRQLFDDFLHSVEQGQNAEVIIVQFTIEGDPCLECYSSADNKAPTVTETDTVTVGAWI